MKILIKISLILFIFTSLQAEIIERSCTPDIVETVNIGELKISFNGMRGSCLITYSAPTRELAGHDTYRTFTANANGIFSIYSSFHNPSSIKLSSTTGQKSFDLQPVKNSVSVRADTETGEVELTLASGEKVYFNNNTGLLDTARTTDLRFSEDPNITHKNQSGVLLISRQGVIFDIPYRQGAEPLALKDKLITIRDPENKKCSIKIQEIYDSVRYDYDSNVPIIDNTLTEARTDRFILKASGAELVRLINSKAPKCQKLDLSSMSSLPEAEHVVKNIDQINNAATSTGKPSSISRSPAVINSGRDGIEIDNAIPSSRPVRETSRILDK